MFTSAKPNKISDQIIEQVRNAILEGKLKPGDKLPSERELIENFRVSKATLREALRSLEVLGFLEIRKGLTGGAFVTEINMKKATDGFINFLHFKNVSLRDLSEVRLILEPYIVEKATHSIAEDELNRLKELIEEGELALKKDITAESRKNEIEFHRIIGGVTGNPILMFILDFVENLLLDAKEILQPGKAFSRRVLKAHKLIYKSLSDRNPDKAREEMVRHVEQVADDLIALQKEKDFRVLNVKTDG
jgi:GntR family transcriptional repressor for pyruvate dehydrogenase complex